MNNGFKFRLDKLLDIRQRKEDESKRLLNNSQRELQQIKNKLNEAKGNYNKYNEITAEDSIVYRKVKKNYLTALTKVLQEAEKQVGLKEREISFRRDELKKKQVERKTVEILKEKQLKEFIKEQERLEQITNDEFALYAYIRNLEGR